MRCWDASNFSLSLQPLQALLVTHQNHVSSLSAWGCPYPPGYVFPLSSRLVAFACWFLPIPLRISAAFIIFGSPTTFVDLIGFSVFRFLKPRSGRVMSILRGEFGIFCIPMHGYALAPSWSAQRPVPWCHRYSHISIRWFFITQPHEQFAFAHPSELSLARFPLWWVLP